MSVRSAVRLSTPAACLIFYQPKYETTLFAQNWSAVIKRCTIQFRFATSLFKWWNTSFVAFLLPPFLPPSFPLSSTQMWVLDVEGVLRSMTRQLVSSSGLCHLNENINCSNVTGEMSLLSTNFMIKQSVLNVVVYSILWAVKCQTNLLSHVPRMLLWRNILVIKVETAQSVVLHLLYATAGLSPANQLIHRSGFRCS